MTKFNVFFCDDIRQEVTGKHLLVGVYSGDLIPASVPSTFPLCVLVRVQGIKGHHRFRAKMTSPDGSIAMDIEDDFDMPPAGDGFPLTFVGATIQVDGPGDITMEIALDDGVPETIGTLKVYIPPPPAQ
jgi:hypothetical protein